MKTRLEELTVTCLISLIEGDFGVLLEDDGKESALSLAVTARNILFEYREIVDPSGMKSYLIETEELFKAHVNHQLFTICDSLLESGYVDEAASIITAMGINGSKLSEDRLRATVRSNLARSKAAIADIGKSRAGDAAKNADIRRHFDEQTAAIMAHFRFQIDTSEMKASIYAHLVARYSREVKAMRNATLKLR